MDRGGPVHREVGDHAAIHEVNEKWRQSRLHDVPAEHYHDRALVFLCRGNRGHDAQEIARDQNVGERFEERGKAAIPAGW